MASRAAGLDLQLRKLEMRGDLFIHVIWVAGTRMIEQGTDGLSRADLMNRVLAGGDMLSFVPLNKTAEERQSGVVQFLMSSTQGCFDFIPLNHPDDWFDKALKPGNFVWIPPPATAREAVEQLCQSKHLCPQGAHIFICPALMTNHWRKRLERIADVVFSVPVGCKLWEREQHEPLIVGLTFPQLDYRPWQVKRDRVSVDELRSALSGLWASDLEAARDLLRQLWVYAKDLSGVPRGVAC
ncbi:hypothetical protein ACA910_015166 [Epithemia clementina (nom. ined.)]